MWFDEASEMEEIIAIQKREETLLKFIQATGQGVTQVNGQRKYGGPPPNWTGPPPPKGCEVFVGKLPRDVCEDELFNLFSSIGVIYELRLMMDFSGSNRGFAFVQFATPIDASRAIEKLNGYELRPKHRIGVLKSIDNCRLFIGGIPRDKSQEEIAQEIERLTEGVSKVIVYSSIHDKTKNRGFAFVEYQDHRLASKARRRLIPERIQFWGKDIAVDWADPEPSVEEEVMSNVKVLYVRNLSLTTTEQSLRDLFNTVSDGDVTNVKSMKDFAFIHFNRREKAELAMKTLNRMNWNGNSIEIMWAKPLKEKNQLVKKGNSRNTGAVAVKPFRSKSAQSSPTTKTSPHRSTRPQTAMQVTSPNHYYLKMPARRTPQLPTPPTPRQQRSPPQFSPPVPMMQLTPPHQVPQQIQPQNPQQIPHQNQRIPQQIQQISIPQQSSPLSTTPIRVFQLNQIPKGFPMPPPSIQIRSVSMVPPSPFMGFENGSPPLPPANYISYPRMELNANQNINFGENARSIPTMVYTNAAFVNHQPKSVSIIEKPTIMQPLCSPFTPNAPMQFSLSNSYEMNNRRNQNVVDQTLMQHFQSLNLHPQLVSNQCPY